MWIKRFMKWASFSFVGHIVLFELLFSIPILLIFLVLIYSEHGLTVIWALYMVFLCGLAGGLIATLFWFTLSQPLIKKVTKGSVPFKRQ